MRKYPTLGAAENEAALRLLAARGKHSYTASEYAAAVEEVADEVAKARSSAIVKRTLAIMNETGVARSREMVVTAAALAENQLVEENVIDSAIETGYVGRNLDTKARALLSEKGLAMSERNYAAALAAVEAVAA